MRVRIKICCISSVEEARLAVRWGADALGLVSAMPSGPGVIDERLIAEIAGMVPPPVTTFLLTSLRDPSEIAGQLRRCRTGAVQICDRVDRAAYGYLRREVPFVRLVQVIHVTGLESVAEARTVAEHVDAILLDSGSRDGAVRELGGTGRVHDWDLSRAICRGTEKPVFLAGGLCAENVAEGIRRVRPFGVDVCSGVRTGGRLDEAKLRAFTASVG